MATDRQIRPPPHQAPRLVGRKREQELLRACLGHVLDGHGQLVLVSGEAGIGKTTLVRDLVRQAEEQGALVLSGGCYDLASTPPYGPWGAAVRGYEPQEGQSSVPVWFEDPDALEQVGSQAALFEEARRFFVRIAER